MRSVLMVYRAIIAYFRFRTLIIKIRKLTLDFFMNDPRKKYVKLPAILEYVDASYQN